MDDATVEVATVVGPERIAVRLHFDAAGDIVASSADARPRAVGKGTIDTPFRGEFADYECSAVFECRLRSRSAGSCPKDDSPISAAG